MKIQLFFFLIKQFCFLFFQNKARKDVKECVWLRLFQFLCNLIYCPIETLKRFSHDVYFIQLPPQACRFYFIKIILFVFFNLFLSFKNNKIFLFFFDLNFSSVFSFLSANLNDIFFSLNFIGSFYGRFFICYVKQLCIVRFTFSTSYRKTIQMGHVR